MNFEADKGLVYAFEGCCVLTKNIFTKLRFEEDFEMPLNSARQWNYKGHIQLLL